MKNTYINYGRWLLFLLLSVLSVQCFAFGLNGNRYAQEGMDYYSRSDYPEAEAQFLLANQAANGKEPEYIYWLAKIQVALSKPQKAYEYLQTYMSFQDAPNKAEVQSMIDILDHQKLIFEDISLHRMPHYVDSRNSDFAPWVTPDGKQMYFTSLRPALKDKENIWTVEKLATVWGKPSIVNEFSTDKNESMGSLSSDSKTAYLFGNYQKGKLDGDIYYSTFDGKWSAPLPLPNVNSPQIDLQPYLVDDKYLFFTSSRDGGQGGTDIYVSEKKGDSWTTPINLGNKINTAKNEQTPYFDWDGKTLFFASDGRDGFGGYDLFKAVKIGPKWTDWSIPENLGLPINSVKDDRYFFRVKNSNEAYFSSDRDNSGFEKLFTALVKVAPREYLVKDEKTGTKLVVKDVADAAAKAAIEKIKKYMTVKGTITDEKNRPLEAEIQWLYNEDGISTKKLTYSGKDGKFETVLPLADSYQYTVNKEGFFMSSGTLKPNAVKSDGTVPPLTLDLSLQPMEVKKVFVFNNIQFRFDSSTIIEASKPIVDEIAATLINNPDLSVEISGHTCNIGTAAYNLKLSERRAKAVVNYLVKKGVDSSKLTYKGFGLTKPVADNSTNAGRIKNRRVEVKVLE